MITVTYGNFRFQATDLYVLEGLLLANFLLCVACILQGFFLHLEEEGFNPYRYTTGCYLDCLKQYAPAGLIRDSETDL